MQSHNLLYFTNWKHIFTRRCLYRPALILARRTLDENYRVLSMYFRPLQSMHTTSLPLRMYYGTITNTVVQYWAGTLSSHGTTCTWAPCIWRRFSGQPWCTEANAPPPRFRKDQGDDTSTSSTFQGRVWQHRVKYVQPHIQPLPPPNWKHTEQKMQEVGVTNRAPHFRCTIEWRGRW